MRKSESTPTPSSGLRRSTRSTASARKSYLEDGENAGRALRRGSPGSAKGAKMLGDDDFVDDSDDEPSGRVKQRNNKALGVRLHDPYVCSQRGSDGVAC